VLVLLGRLDAAADSLQHAVALEPTSARAHYELAIALSHGGGSAGSAGSASSSAMEAAIEAAGRDAVALQLAEAALHMELAAELDPLQFAAAASDLENALAAAALAKCQL
jgi:hypothetical protein